MTTIRPRVRRLPCHAEWIVEVRLGTALVVVLHEAPDRLAALDYARQWAGFRAAMLHDWGAGAPR